jgi:glycerol dehydrogenase-like iron-containing ADH family enzyme
VSALQAAPAVLLRGDGAIDALAARFGAGARVLVVHGPVGFNAVRERLAAALERVGAVALAEPHEGPCCATAIDAHAAAAERERADWVLGVGGGRVIDAAKGAAQRTRTRFASLPTSPATCAATAPTVVLYDDHGAHVEALEGGTSAAACALDPALLASVPDRLLVAGVLDAWAKVHEVRLTAARLEAVGATTRAALALVDDLAALLREHAAAAVAAGPGGARDASLLARRRLVAEAVVLYPGLIGGLAGADAKLALAHPLHDALTHLPGAHGALHGEKVAFGTLVQLRVAGHGGGVAEGGGVADDGSRRRAMRDEATVYAGLGARVDLASLGCSEARAGDAFAAIVRRTIEDDPVRLALPWLGGDTLGAAILEVDDWLRSAAAGGRGGAA